MLRMQQPGHNNCVTCAMYGGISTLHVAHTPMCMQMQRRVLTERTALNGVKRRGVTWCAQATTWQRTHENKRGLLEVQRKTGCHPRRPTPRKPLCVRHDMWLCWQNRQTHNTQCRVYWDM
jgi:hypothetical protein